MSYKFPIYRCTDCGVVAFDPPHNDEPYKCGITRRINQTPTLCSGEMRYFALVDSDSFIALGDNWHK